MNLGVITYFLVLTSGILYVKHFVQNAAVHAARVAFFVYVLASVLPAVGLAVDIVVEIRAAHHSSEARSLYYIMSSIVFVASLPKLLMASPSFLCTPNVSIIFVAVNFILCFCPSAFHIYFAFDPADFSRNFISLLWASWCLNFVFLVIAFGATWDLQGKTIALVRIVKAFYQNRVSMFKMLLACFHAVVHLDASRKLICGCCQFLEFHLQAQMQGESMYSFLQYETAERVRNIARTVTSTGEASHRIKITLIAGASGRALPAEVKILRRDDASGNPAEYLFCLNVLDVFKPAAQPDPSMFDSVKSDGSAESAPSSCLTLWYSPMFKVNDIVMFRVESDRFVHGKWNKIVEEKNDVDQFLNRQVRGRTFFKPMSRID